MYLAQGLAISYHSVDAKLGKALERGTVWVSSSPGAESGVSKPAGAVALHYGQGLVPLADDSDDLLVFSDSMQGVLNCIREGVAYRRFARSRLWVAGVLGISLAACAVLGLLSWFPAAVLGIASNAALSSHGGR